MLNNKYLVIPTAGWIYNSAQIFHLSVYIFYLLSILQFYSHHEVCRLHNYVVTVRTHEICVCVIADI